MTSRKHIELIRMGDYVAEVSVTLEDDDQPGMGWGPYYSLEDALKLDDVRRALRAGRFDDASRLARIYRLTPVTAA